jgi:chemotaxis protein CheD
VTMAELLARMAEIAVSRHDGDVLVALGLGSCIGVALLDGASLVAGLAHVVLPESRPGTATPGKFADTAVPELLRRVTGLGASASRLHAVLVGGAQMFSASASTALDIGHRNEQAVRTALAVAGIPITTTLTGGSAGRTLRVHVGTGLVTCKQAGSPEQTIAVRDAGRLRVAA